MKATEIIKQYHLKYDTASGRYKSGGNIVDELIEVNEKVCLFIKGSANISEKNVLAVENDLPALEHWESDPEKGFKCSRCGAEACCLRHNDNRAYMVLTSFCYRCGAKMDIDYDENE